MRPRVVALRDAIRALDERGDRLRARGGRPTRRARGRRASATTPRRAGEQQRLAQLRALHRIELRARAAPIRASPRASGSRPRLRRRSAASSMPGTVCTLARTGTMALRVMPPLSSPVAAPGVDLVARGVAQHHAEHRVVAREVFDLASTISSRSSRSTPSDTRSETWRASSPARSVSSPSTRLRASAEAVSSSAACCARFS